MKPIITKVLPENANFYYENAAKKVEYLTGIYVAFKTQQRLVKRTEFNQADVNDEIKECSWWESQVKNPARKALYMAIL